MAKGVINYRLLLIIKRLYSLHWSHEIRYCIWDSVLEPRSVNAKNTIDKWFWYWNVYLIIMSKHWSKTTWTNLRSSLHDAHYSALFLPWQLNTWIRSVSPPGLNQHQRQGSSFICNLWPLLRKTYFHSTKKGLSLVDSWSHGALTKFK